MPENKHYIQAILPLHLEWEPWYWSDTELVVGQIIKVPIGRRITYAVVSSTGGSPEIDSARISRIETADTGLPDILPSEIEFWRFIAGYYMCTTGDVFKYAYPAERFDTELKSSKKKLSCRTEDACEPELDIESDSRPFVVCGWNRETIYEQNIKNTLKAGKDVLVLRPCARNESLPTIRELSRAVKSDIPTLLDGSKALLFLPFKKLGLIIVDNEHSLRYKHNQSPRFNGRDAAIALSSIHRCRIILGSGTPSLETIYNIRTGRFDSMTITGETAGAAPVVIDVDSERRKNGMVGSRSRKLISAMEGIPEKNVLEISSLDLRKHLEGKKLEKYELVCVSDFDYLLSKNDFRADEKAFQMLCELRHRCRGKLFIQTRNAAHPIFSANDSNVYCNRLLVERKDFDLPPFTRLVEIRKPAYRQTVQSSDAPVSFGGQQTVRQYFLKRDSSLSKEKAGIRKNTAPGLIIDVDPL